MSPNDRSREVRPLALDEARIVVDWARGEGWNPGLGDADVFHATDSDGFIGLFEGSALVAAISAVRYSPGFGFIGLFIVRPDRRGLGLGRAVWQVGMSRLDGATIGLDGVREQQANYARQGFVPAFRTIRYAGVATPTTRDPRIRTFTSDHAAKVSQIDRRCFPADRQAFLAGWLNPPHRSFVHTEGAHVDGYATLRQCSDGHKIGPLFAEKADVARRLIEAIATTIPDERIVIDVPQTNRRAVELVEALGLAPVFETMRMYRGPAPDISIGEVFGITTFELG